MLVVGGSSSVARPSMHCLSVYALNCPHLNSQSSQPQSLNNSKAKGIAVTKFFPSLMGFGRLGIKGGLHLFPISKLFLPWKQWRWG